MKTFDITEKLNIKPVNLRHACIGLPTTIDMFEAEDLGLPDKGKLTDGVFTIDRQKQVWMYVPEDKIIKLLGDWGRELFDFRGDELADGIFIYISITSTIEYMIVRGYTENLGKPYVSEYAVTRMMMTNVRANMFKSVSELKEFWKNMKYFEFLTNRLVK